MNEMLLTEREKALARDLGELRRVLDNVSAHISIIDLRGKLLEVNRVLVETTGLVRDDVLGQPIWDCYWWAGSPDLQAQLKSAFAQASDGHTIRYDTEIYVLGGTTISLDFQLAPLRDEHDDIVLVIASGMDITARKQRETHITTLMREVAHRSKNLLAVIQAMARQTLIAGGTAEEFEKRFSARIQALAFSHDLLVTENWRGASVHELVRSQLAHQLDLGRDRIKISGPDVMLNPEAAQNIGLALHELSINAEKYGALASDAGYISIAWSINRQGGERRFVFDWLECGGPEVSPPNHEGFGHKVMKRIAANALNGDAHLDFAPHGLHWSLAIPVTYLLNAF